MADTKISALTSATTPLAGTEVLPIVQSGATVKVSVANLTAGRAVSAGSLTSDGDISFSANALYLKGKTSGGISTRLIGINSGNTVYIGSIDTQAAGGVIFINGTQFMGVDTSNNITFNAGNLVQGTAAKGVNFTANTPAAGMTSQLLNWYEQGTWTPSIANSFNNYTHTIQVGRYTRVGNLVTVQFTIAWTTTNAGGFSFAVEGLPFTPVTLTNYASGGSIGKVDRLTTIKQVMCQVESATASIKFYELNTGAVATALASASWNVAGSANLVSGTVTYQV